MENKLLKCYRIWFEDGSAILRDAEDERDARAQVEKEYGKIKRIECLD